MKTQLQAISLLSATETSLANQIRQFLQGKFSVRLVFKTHPSTFIKPDWLKGDSDDRVNALYTGVVLFSLLMGNRKRSKIILAVIDADALQAESIASILRTFGVPSLVTTITLNLDRKSTR